MTRSAPGTSEAASAPNDLETRASDQHHQALRLWLRLLACTNRIEGEIRRRLRSKFNTTLPRFDLMAQLDKAPAGMKLGELSQRLMVSNGNITGLVDRLVAQGLLDRQPAPNDRRAQLVRLTAEGRKSFRAMAASHEDWVAEILGDLTSSERETLMRLLGKAKASARKAMTDGDE